MKILKQFKKLFRLKNNLKKKGRTSFFFFESNYFEVDMYNLHFFFQIFVPYCWILWRCCTDHHPDWPEYLQSAVWLLCSFGQQPHSHKGHNIQSQPAGKHCTNIECFVFFVFLTEPLRKYRSFCFTRHKSMLTLHFPSPAHWFVRCKGQQHNIQHAVFPGLRLHSVPGLERPPPLQLSQDLQPPVRRK